MTDEPKFNAGGVLEPGAVLFTPEVGEVLRSQLGKAWIYTAEGRFERSPENDREPLPRQPEETP